MKSTSAPVGCPGPDFILPAVDGTVRTLSAYLGTKVVIVFYRGHWCGACRQQLAELRSTVQMLEDAGAAVLAISAEPLERAREGAEVHGLGFTILSDEGLSAIDRYGVRHEGEPEAGGRAIARPSIFVLDRHGVIRYAHIGQDPLDRPTIHLVLLAIEALD